MNAKEAIYNFQYSEKMKSGLIIGTGMLELLTFLKGDEEHYGGRRMLTGYFEGLLRELRIAESVLGPGHFAELENKLMEVTGRIEMSQYQEALRSISEAISLATTFCQGSMNALIEKGLL